jgi:hypothetical protein
MKEEEWSIRKMRELQSKSQTRNTYKHSETFELNAEGYLPVRSSASRFDSLLKRLQLLLEE